MFGKGVASLMIAIVAMACGSGSPPARPPGSNQLAIDAATSRPPVDAAPPVDAGPPDAPAVPPLTQADVDEMVAAKHTGLQRCYFRALKADPFLKVESIDVTIQVDASGAVTRVELSSQAGTPLGDCLTAAIGRWVFRATDEGIEAEVTVYLE